MNKKKGLLLIIAIIAISALINACKKPSSNDTTPGGNSNFDKAAMLIHYADDLIVPGYLAMQQQLELLHDAAEACLAAPNATTQAALNTAYTNAHLQYERIAAFQFGPAETALLDVFFNYAGGLDYTFATAGELTGFSVDTATIENNIASGTYDLTATTRASLYAQGFPALSYLYFAPDAMGKFAVNTAARAAYARAVLSRMQLLIDNVAAGWTSYRTDFSANTTTSSGSPIGNMVNQLAYQLDLMKGPRIGWPLGKQSNGIAFPTKCEGYYPGISAALAVENLVSLKKLYTGNESSKSLSGYLVALNRATLNDEVLAQFDAAIAALKLIPDPLSATLVGQPAIVDAAYKEIQKLLTLMKTDVASATAVQITFTDNDGD